MSQPDTITCTTCQRPIPATARFCSHCGTPVGGEHHADDILVSAPARLTVTHDELDLPGLVSLVDSSVTFWRQRVQSAEPVARAQAATVLDDLSRIFASLSQQLAQGRKTVRITTRLPQDRAYPLCCPLCGHGNREAARFCKQCGAALSGQAASPPSVPGVPVFRLALTAQSDVGQVRKHNEDVCYADRLHTANGLPLAVLLVADGMGGAQAGEEASRLACETALATLRERLQTATPADDASWQALLRTAVQAANQQVYEQAQQHSDLAGMGTTLTLLLVVGMRAHLAHVGDSRAYLCNASGVTEDGATVLQLTTDHTLVARLVEIGQLTPEAARTHQQRNMIYRALGNEPTIEVDTHSHALSLYDGLLLCSDGLTAYMDGEEAARQLFAAGSVHEAASTLIALANKRGGRDNISVALALLEQIEHVCL